MPKVIPPNPDHDDAWFWEGVRAHKLLLRRCARCRRLCHPPVPMCGDCHSLEWETVEASGRGTIQTWILSHHPTQPDALPRIVVLVDLEEGVRLVSNLVGSEPGEVRNELPVELVFVDYDGVLLPQFRLSAA